MSHGPVLQAAMYPVPSPDGAMLAYIRVQSALRRAVIATTQGRTRVTGVGRRVTDLCWLDRGTTLAYLNHTADGDELRTLDAVRGDDAVLARAERIYAPMSRGPGGLLAVGYSSGDPQAAIAVYDTRSRTRVATSPPDADCSEPSWSPDGRRLAFLLRAGGPHPRFEVCVVEAACLGELTGRPPPTGRTVPLAPQTILVLAAHPTGAVAAGRRLGIPGICSPRGKEAGL